MMESRYILNKFLVGTEIKTFIIASYSVEIGFSLKSSPDVIYWLCFLSDSSVSSNTQEEKIQERDVFVQKLYSLFLQKVTSVEIDSSGKLSIFFNTKKLTVFPDNEIPEVVWFITPNSKSFWRINSWCVALTDLNGLLAVETFTPKDSNEK